ncbi:hypothetical protein PRZ48_001426 [Zasmidium cellare]|uniref:Major facilitator superfamily (MFS) profile domain-containing protein n=1 Tax=Zasmidium cellare TaxID=395010 RepID=A0ABR0F184_ZASCE|nr:hypothetical protein PRZ48_001426 [Zasmidium cellare]
MPLSTHSKPDSRASEDVERNQSLDGHSTSDGETDAARIERLGRQRPEKLDSMWKEVGFVFSITVSQLLSEYFISGFTLLLPTVTVALDIPEASSTWPASAFSLVISSFLIPFGRLADIYGGFPVYIAGCVWYCAWSIIAGFAQNELMLDMCRALQGLGPAAYLPAGLQLLGSMYRPGPRKNMVFSIYGAMAPFGFFIGLFFAGVSSQFTTWRWYFWIGAILIALTTVIAFFTIPSDSENVENNCVKMDWYGTITIVSGLILVVFAITDSAHAPNGWASIDILLTFLGGLIILGIAFWIEGWVAEQPLLPFWVFKLKFVRPFVLGLLFAYGTLGIYLLYASFYCIRILNTTPMQLVAWYVPMAIIGIFLAIFGGAFLHILSPRILMLVTGVAIIIESVLFALAPSNAKYWAWIFIPMIMATVSIDIIFNVANIFFSSTLPSRQQGFAGALSNVLLQLGIAIMLGFAEIIASETAYQGQRQSYQNVFWFNLACGATALVILMAFVRIDRAKADLTADEKELQRRQEENPATR